jgi:hypothetical protein
MMKKILTIVTIFFLMAGIARSQEKTTKTFTNPRAYYTASWNTTFTLGDFHKWVSNTTPAGFDFAGRYFVAGGLAVGFNTGWQRVGQAYGYQTLTIPSKGIALTATNYRMTWMVPIQVAFDYHFLTSKVISPYIGLGIGTDYMEHHLMIQEYDLNNDRWDFSMTPEIGALVRFGEYSNWEAQVAFNYKWTTNKIELYSDKKLDHLQMVNLKVGISYIID